VSVVALLPLSGAAADVTRDPAQRAAARAAIYRENPYLAAAVGQRRRFRQYFFGEHRQSYV
jgi:hypothetical protein